MRVARKLVNVLFYLAFGFTLVNWAGWPVELRFEESHRNYFFIAGLCAVLPILLMIKILMLKISSRFLVAFLASSSLGFFCFIVGYFAYTDGINTYKRGQDFSLELIDEVVIREDLFRLYRTNGGATTSFGLVLRKESKLIFGLNAVDRIFDKYKASEAEIHTSDGELILVIQPYSRNETIQTVRFKV